MKIKKVRIIWDNKKSLDRFIKLLRLDKLNIFDSIKNVEIEVCNSSDSFFLNKADLTIKKTFTGADAYFVLAECTWFDNPNTQYYGLELVKSLRLNGVLDPIFIVSNTRFDSIFSPKVPLSKILKTPGHYYIHFNSEGLAFEKPRKIRKLTKELLADISLYVFTKQGIVREALHLMKNSLITLQKNKNNKALADLIDTRFNHFFQSIEGVVDHKNRNKWLKIKYEFVTNLETTNNPTGAFDKFRADLIEITQADILPQKKIAPAHYNWQVLLIEDDEDTIDFIEQKCRQYNISVISASNSALALDILKHDFHGRLKSIKTGINFPANSITVVIIDIRLLDKEGYWDNLQGYELIEAINRDYNNLLSFFVLTNKTLTLHETVAKRENREYWYLKDILIDNKGFDEFAGNLIREGQQTLEKILSRPRRGYWLKSYLPRFSLPLQDYYTAYRLSRDYVKYEKEVNDFALSYVIAVNHQKSTLGEVQNVRKLYLRHGLKANASDPANIIAFKDKLTGRRIVIGLWLTNYLYNLKNMPEVSGAALDFDLIDWNIDEITILLQTGSLSFAWSEDLGDDFERKLEQAIKSIINTNLNFSKNIDTEIPNYLLIEEKAWLENLIKNIPIHNLLYLNNKSVFLNAQVLFSEIIDRVNYEWSIDLKKSDAEKHALLVKKHGELLTNEIIRVENKEEMEAMKKEITTMMDEFFPANKNEFLDKAEEIESYIN